VTGVAFKVVRGVRAVTAGEILWVVRGHVPREIFSEIPFHALWKEIYRVLNVTKCYKIPFVYMHN
jgi:hypothetical protein